MKKNFLITVLSVLVAAFFGAYSHAAIENCDFSNPRNGNVDGSDLAEFAAYYAALNPNANVNGDGSVNEADVAHFAGFFGSTFSPRPPNILLIIADDVGVDVTSNLYSNLIDQLEAMYGTGVGVRGKPASLPNLTDRLATQGTVFSNAWAQPYCSPTRATVLTGLFEDKTQVKIPDNPLVYNSDPSKRHITFVKKLQDAGYSTALVGKWHLAGSCSGTPPTCSGTLPKQAGFDSYRGHNAAFISGYWSDGTNTANNYPLHWQDSGTATNSYSTIAAGSVPARSLPAGTTPAIASTTYEPVVRAADAIDWINAHPNDPWFVWLAFNLSHVTVQTPSMHVPPENMLDTATKTDLNTCLGTAGQYGVNPPSVGNCVGTHLMRAMTNAMDTAIGKVLDVLDSLDSDTYVIFIGDNGTPMYGNTMGNQIDNMYPTSTRSGRGKSTPYESGCRVPMAIRGPGIAALSQSSAPVHVADLFSTILTLAGLQPPETVPDSTGASTQLDSKSLTPILFGSANDTGRDPNTGYLLTEVGTYVMQPNKVGARNATYKVICNTNATNFANCTFYNLIDDPLEATPLTKPGSCPATCGESPCTTANPEWHFCQLIDVILDYSIFP
jgi:arylsulfatase A-like enzyme